MSLRRVYRIECDTSECEAYVDMGNGESSQKFAKRRRHMGWVHLTQSQMKGNQWSSKDFCPKHVGKAKELKK